MLAAAKIGVSRTEWSLMTPRELAFWLQARREHMEDEARGQRRNSYNLASLIRSMVWARHAPSFEAAFPHDSVKIEMSDEQMYAQVRALNRLFGGTEEN